MFILYSKVVYNLWFKSTNPVSGFTQVTVIKKRKKVTKILVTVSVLYTVCWLPEAFVYVIQAYDGSLVGSTVYPISVALLSINSAANPFIYCLHSSRFREHLKNLIKSDYKRFSLCRPRERIQPKIEDHPQTPHDRETEV
jgi:hypothetical protein